MSVIFVSGPYRGHRLLNILRARRAAIFVWQHGGVALCPHLNTAFFDRYAPEAVWIAGALELLARCDAVWVIEGWQRSEGTRIEIAEAERLGLPCFYSREAVMAYLESAIGEGAASAEET